MTASPISAAPASTRQNWRGWLLPFAILALVMIIGIIVRIRLLNAPLERDEGEHGYLAQTLLQGYAPWQLAYNLKLPGTDAAYALFMGLFGQTAVAIRLGLLLVNTATILLMVLLGKRLFGITGGAVTGASYGLLSCSQGVLGTIAHSTHFVVFFSVIGTLLLLKAGNRPAWLFLTGLTCGIAFLMKQPGLAFGAFGLLFLAWRRRSLKQLASYCFGLALPYALLCFGLWRAGTFSRFWFWTVTLAGAFAGQHSIPVQAGIFALQFPTVVHSVVAFWILAGLGVALALRNPSTRRPGLFVTALLVFSFIAVSGGGVFNPHYFILMLPALALANGAFVVAADGILAKRRAGSVALSCFALACLGSIFLQRDYLFSMTPYQFERASYGLNPFPEAVQVADYIRSHSEPGARIAVVGSEAEIYFYSRRQAATGYLFTYGLMETHRYALPSQMEMIREIELARPEYLVFVGIGTSWLQRPDSPREILRWVPDYTNRYYEVVGAINLRPGAATSYAWGPDALVYNGASQAYITVYRRRQERP